MIHASQIKYIYTIFLVLERETNEFYKIQSKLFRWNKTSSSPRRARTLPNSLTQSCSLHKALQVKKPAQTFNIATLISKNLVA